jgi:hypothetical protein
MLIAATLFIFIVTLVGVILVKAYEHRQDVLYGPYLRQRDRTE